MAKWIEGTVVGQRQWTDRLFSLQVDADVGSFEPGQWAKLAQPVIFDGRNLYDPAVVKAHGFEYHPIGRRT